MLTECYFSVGKSSATVNTDQDVVIQFTEYVQTPVHTIIIHLTGGGALINVNAFSTVTPTLHIAHSNIVYPCLP